MTDGPLLSDLQLSVMQALWQRGEGTVSEIHEALLTQRDLAVTTVATLLSRLEKRGLLIHRVTGRQFVYRPTVTEEDVRQDVVSRVADRVFRGDVTELVCQLLSARELAPGDLDRVKSLIREREEQTTGEEAEDDARD
ncbi:MAG: BlaI family transcriptional regulator [Planctomycetes bacterium]|nr:BlaI family transcriptional regulator [Planctomycetota bacterium]